MTEVILHGGYKGFWEGAGNDHRLFQKLIDGAKSSDNKILLAFLVQEKLAEFPFMEELLSTFKELDSTVEIVIADRSNFRELLPKYKVLFLQGGGSTAHQEFLKDFSKEEISDGKVLLAGSSSGASMLCEYCFTSSGNCVLKGKGIVNIAMIPHADSGGIGEYTARLKEITNLPILLINESEMVELSI